MATFDINNLRSNLQHGGARPTLFQVQITNPANPVADIKVPFLCQATDIPEMAVGIIEAPYMGRRIKLPGDRTFQNWAVQIINDEDFAIRNTLEQWNNMINSLEGNLRQFPTSAPSELKSTGLVQQYDKTGNIIRVYEVDGIWPTNLSAIPLNWAQQDTIETFTCVFAYDWWQPGSGGTTGSFNP